MTPQVAFRVNGGPEVGLGHLRRCLTLAQALIRRGTGVLFFVNDDGGSARLLEESGVDVLRVPAQEIRHLDLTRRHIADRGVQALVVDSYDVAADALGHVEVPVAAIVDAPPPAPLPVQMLTNAAADAPSRPCPAGPATRLLLGPRFVLLREEFASPGRGDVRNDIARVLISTGGSDPGCRTPQLMRLVHAALPDAHLDVVAGPYFSEALLGDLDRLAAILPASIHRNPRRMRALMADADLAVTAGGQTVYELAATGTPAIAVCFADNQRANLTGMAARGALVYAGDVSDAAVDVVLTAHIRALAGDPGARQRMSSRAREVVDGQGAARVADEVLALLRPAC